MEVPVKHGTNLSQASWHNGSYVIFIFWLVSPHSNVVQTFAQLFALWITSVTYVMFGSHISMTLLEIIVSMTALYCCITTSSLSHNNVWYIWQCSYMMPRIPNIPQHNRALSATGRYCLMLYLIHGLYHGILRPQSSIIYIPLCTACWAVMPSLRTSSLEPFKLPRESIPWWCVKSSHVAWVIPWHLIQSSFWDPFCSLTFVILMDFAFEHPLIILIVLIT